VRYSAFANDLRSDALQDLGDILSQLATRAARHIGGGDRALPRGTAGRGNCASPDEIVIDAEARVVLERLAVPGSDLRRQGHKQDV
jgi:hypothetical protein